MNRAYGALADSPESAADGDKRKHEDTRGLLTSPPPLDSALTPVSQRARDRKASGAASTAVCVSGVKLHTAGDDLATGPEWGRGGRASILSSSFNLTCNLIGSGMLAMPWALKESSLISGCVILGLLAVFNAISMILLAKCCDMARSFSYQKIGTRALGATAGVVIQITMLAYTFSSCLSYIILIGDFVPNAVESMRPDRFGLDATDLRLYVILIISLAILLPLSFIRNLYSLRFTSAIAMLAIFYTLGLTLQSLHGHLTPMPRDLELWAFPVCSWRALAVMNVAFTAHYNGPRFFQELENRSLSRFSMVNAIAMSASLAIYASIAVAGYWRFSAGVQGDLMLNFETNDVYAIVARISLAIGMAFSFPLCFHSIRTSTFALFCPDLLIPAHQTLRSPKYVLVTLLLVGINVILGIVLTQIETVMSYKGSILGCAIVYIFPALMYLALKKRERIRAARKDAQARHARFARVAKRTASDRITEESAQCESDQLDALAKASGLEPPLPVSSPLSIKLHREQLAWEQQRQRNAAATGGMVPESPMLTSPDASDSVSVSYAYERDALESTDLDIAYYNLAGNHASLPRARESPPVVMGGEAQPSQEQVQVTITNLSVNGTPANDAAAAAATLPAGAAARHTSPTPSLASLPFSASRATDGGVPGLGSYHSISEQDFSCRSGDDHSGLLRTVTPSYVVGNNFLQNAPAHPVAGHTKHAQSPQQQQQHPHHSPPPIHSRVRRDGIASPVGYRRPNIFVRAWNSLFGPAARRQPHASEYQPAARDARASSRGAAASAADDEYDDLAAPLSGSLPNTLSFNSPFSIDSTSVEHEAAGNDHTSANGSGLAIDDPESSFARDLCMPGLVPTGSTQGRWLTMDSRLFHAFAVFMAAWGVAAGMMGLVINILVQAGQMQQCA